MSQPTIKKLILDTIGDLAFDFLIDDRCEDEELSSKDILIALESEDITIDEMVDCFRKGIEENLKNID